MVAGSVVAQTAPSDARLIGPSPASIARLRSMPIAIPASSFVRRTSRARLPPPPASTGAPG